MPKGGLYLYKRVHAEMINLLLVAVPLCLLTGLLIGFGFMSVADKFLHYADTSVLFQILPSNIKAHGMFKLLEPTFVSERELLIFCVKKS